jgi:hypothetical protein
MSAWPLLHGASRIASPAGGPFSTIRLERLSCFPFEDVGPSRCRAGRPCRAGPAHWARIGQPVPAAFAWALHVSKNIRQDFKKVSSKQQKFIT